MAQSVELNGSLRDLWAFRLIGTPIEAPLRSLRSLRELPSRFTSPQWNEVRDEENYIHKILHQVIQNPMNCVDIGAHLGSMISKMRKLSPDGKHMAFEPIPYKHKWIKSRYTDVDVQAVALSNEAGQVDFYVQPLQSGFSGMRLHGKEGETQHHRVTVPTARLDDVWQHDRSVDFIKVDVEGAELLVLRGAEKILQKDKPYILFECTLSGLGTFQISPQTMFDFFQSHGYSIYKPKDWVLKGKPLTFDLFSTAMAHPAQAFNFFAVSDQRR